MKILFKLLTACLLLFTISCRDDTTTPQGTGEENNNKKELSIPIWLQGEWVHSEVPQGVSFTMTPTNLYANKGTISEFDFCKSAIAISATITEPTTSDTEYIAEIVLKNNVSASYHFNKISKDKILWMVNGVSSEFIRVGSETENPDPEIPSEMLVAPPAWIVGRWIDETNLVEAKFTSDNLLFTVNSLGVITVDIKEEAKNPFITIKELRKSDSEYQINSILDNGMGTSYTTPYRFTKITNTQIKYYNPVGSSFLEFVLTKKQ